MIIFRSEAEQIGNPNQNKIKISFKINKISVTLPNMHKIIDQVNKK